MAYLVHCQPSTYSEALQAAVAPAAPRYVVKAIEFMHANLAHDISIGDLAIVADVGARALHEGFRRFRSTTPMAMLRAIRLTQARTALLAADEREHVATIAMECGFTHLGRFSRLYRARYGEMPSQTLRRSANSARNVDHTTRTAARAKRIDARSPSAHIMPSGCCSLERSGCAACLAGPQSFPAARR